MIFFLFQFLMKLQDLFFSLLAFVIAAQKPLLNTALFSSNICKSSETAAWISCVSSPSFAGADCSISAFTYYHARLINHFIRAEDFTEAGDIERVINLESGVVVPAEVSQSVNSYRLCYCTALENIIVTCASTCKDLALQYVDAIDKTDQCPLLKNNTIEVTSGAERCWIGLVIGFLLLFN